MTIRSPMVIIALAILSLAPAAEAQFMPGTSPMDMSVQSRALTSSVINRNALRGTARSSADRRAQSTERRAAGTPSETLSDARFPFQASPALSKQVISEFVDRVRSTGPEAARAVETELSSAVFHQSFADTMRANGLWRRGMTEGTLLRLTEQLACLGGHDDIEQRIRGNAEGLGRLLLEVEDLPAA